MGQAYVPERRGEVFGSPLGPLFEPPPLGAFISLSSLRLEDLVHTVLEATRQVTGCDSPAILLLDEERGRLELKGASPNATTPPFGSWRLDEVPAAVARVLAKRRSRVVDFGSLEPSQSDAAVTRDLRHVLFVPLVIVDRAIGLISVRDSARPAHRFEPAVVALVEGIASQAAVAIENVRLYEDALEAARLNGALNEIDAELNGITDFEEALDHVLLVAGEALRCETAAVSVLDGNEWRNERVLGFPPDLVGGTYPRDGLLHANHALETRVPLVIHDTAEDALVDQALMGELGVGSAIVIPLFHGQDTFGVMFLNHPEPQRFSHNQVDFATKLGAHVSLAWNGRRLLEQNRRSARLALALNSVNEILLASVDGGDMLSSVVEEVARAFQADGSVAFVREDAPERAWALRFCGGILQRFEGRRLTGERAELLRDEARRGLAFIEDVRSTPLVLEDDAVTATGTRSVILLPLSIQNDVFGVLAFAYRAPRRFSDDDRTFARGLSNALTNALETGRAREEERERAHLNERLAAIDGILHSTMEFDEIVGHALREGVAAVGAETAALSLKQGETMRVVRSLGFDSDLAGLLVPVEREPHGVLAMNTRAIVAIQDARTDPRCDKGHLQTYGVRAVAAIPLVIRDEAEGVIYFNYASGTHRFSPNEMDFLGRLGSSLSLSLENAQAYAAEHRIAHTLQEALLALPDDVRGIDFAHDYRAASQTERVGGDFFDVFELEHGLLGVVVGDVSGKGLDAAVLTALVKNTIRAHAIVKGNTPAQVIRHVSTVLMKESRTETFVTVFFGMLDRRDGRLVYCNAAHPPPFAVSDAGARRLRTNSPIAGALRDAVFINSETHLAVGELLFLYTDGLTEARDGSELYGEERLFVQLAREADRDPATAIERVVDDAVAFAGGRLSDDLAVLAIRRRPLPARQPMQQKLPLWGGQD